VWEAIFEIINEIFMKKIKVELDPENAELWISFHEQHKGDI
jgi:hypothetical protein